MILKIDYKEFMKTFKEKYIESWTHDKAMYDTFFECFKDFFWQACELGEDVKPYILTEEDIQNIFFKVIFRAWYNEYNRLWLLDNKK